MSVLLLILVNVLIGVFAQLALKKGMNNIGYIDVHEIFTKEIFSIVFEKYVLTGLALYGFASLLWLVILSQAELSYAYPLIALSYIFVAIFAKIFFNESLTFFRLLGIFLIISGAYFIVK
jgi:drug/metabolite transporter (DMT)-like permease